MITVKALSQADSRWKEDKLGFGTGEMETIGYIGCLMTCLTMVTNSFGYDETPQSFNEKMKASGGFAGSSVRPVYLPKVFPGVRFKKRIPCNNPPAPLAEVDAHLAAGFPVIVQVDYSPLQEGVQSHWILLIGKQGNDYIVQDPYPIKNKLDPVLLSSVKYGASGKPHEVIRDIILYEGPPPGQTEGAVVKSTPTSPTTPGPVPVTRKPVPADALIVYTAEDRLGLRRQPLQADGNLIRRLLVKSKLTVLEPSNTAREKVGKQDAWLEVQTEDGVQGYVAAWYVSLTRTPATPATAQTPSASGPLVVYASPTKLSFRRQPQISASNLIRYVPQDTPFVVLEQPAGAQKKLGKQGQWLNVRDVQGAVGYVAAWCVSASPTEPILSVRISDETSFSIPMGREIAEGEPAGFVVRATEEGISLCSRPGMEDEALGAAVTFAAELLVLDPAGEAESKLGKAGQWLRVRDLYGKEGYIPAWQVVKRPLPSGDLQPGS